MQPSDFKTNFPQLSYSRSLSDMCFRDEANEAWPDARPQAWKNRKRIR